MSNKNTNKSHTGFYQNLIDFVPQRLDHSLKQKSTKRKCGTSLEGDSAKVFYETLLNGDPESPSTSHSSKEKGRKLQHKVHSNKPDQSSRKESRKQDQITNTEKISQAQPKLRKTSKPKMIPNNSDLSEEKSNNVKESSNQKQASNTNSRDVSKLLRCAQAGDCEEVKRLVSSGVDVNARDMYGWTPLMCAAQAGQLNTVKCCLELCADIQLTNDSGGTAENLARSAGHLDIAVTIPSWQPEKPSSSREESAQASVPEPLWCQVCQVSYCDIGRGRHASSTIHLFNAGHKPVPPSYSIPESNKGFQIMLRTGWEVEHGLGPTGAGKKYPVKTVFKQDRKGLGVDSTKRKARVTHFEPNNKDAISHVPPTRIKTARAAAKDARRSKERRDQRWERNLRHQLNAEFF